MHLLQLAPELLTLIFEQIGAAHMRSSVSYLLVSRAWYHIAHPVYLSGLELSTLYLSSRDLERLPHAQCPLSKLIQSNTTRLSLRTPVNPRLDRVEVLSAKDVNLIWVLERYG